MRVARIKVPATSGESVYHVMTRVVNGERLIHDAAKEVLRRQLWQVAEFCGVEILTYAILSNHFHVLVRVPHFTAISDDELLRRYRVLYPHPTVYQQARLGAIIAQLKTNGAEAAAWRARQLRLMHDISPFMKLVKQRYSIWHNKTHQRFGTLWAERFKSVLIESRSGVVQSVAAYIDLNSVRAGLADDPKDYRFCGYAEAVAGCKKAQSGLCSVATEHAWATFHAHYRQLLFGTGAGAREHAGGITPAEFDKVIQAGGKLPLAEVLRCRVRYFADGAVLGGRAFVTQQLASYREKTGRRRKRDVHEVPSVTDWGEMIALRALRRHPFG